LRQTTESTTANEQMVFSLCYFNLKPISKTYGGRGKCWPAEENVYTPSKIEATVFLISVHQGKHKGWYIIEPFFRLSRIVRNIVLYSEHSSNPILKMVLFAWFGNPANA